MVPKVQVRMIKQIKPHISPQGFTLRQRLSWMLQIHLLVLLVLLAIAVILLAGQEKFAQLLSILIVTYLAVFFNMVCFSILRQRKFPNTLISHLIIVFDVLLISIFVHFTGGLISFFSLAYFLTIVASSIFISYNAGLATAMYSFAALGSVVLLEYYGVISHFPLFDINKRLPNDYIYVYLTVFMSGILFYIIALIGGQVQKYIRQTQASIAQVEKMSFLGRLAAGVAHEVNNPLSNVITYLDSIEETGKQLSFNDLTTIRQELRRASGILNKMLSFARSPESKVSVHDINATIKDAVKMLRYPCQRANVELRLELTEQLPTIACSSTEITEIIINLAFNALDAMRENGGFLVIRTALETGSEQIIMEISDNGCGIPQHDLGRIFEPFFTTKEVGQGTGLGLFIIFGMVKNFGGTLDVKSEVRRGTTFSIKFPATPEKKG